MDKVLLFLFLIFTLFTVNAQKIDNSSSLKLEEIMKGDEFIGHQPTNVRWTMDGRKILFDWNRYNQPGESTYAYDILKGTIDSVTYQFYEKNAPYSEVRNNTYALYTLNGNLYRYTIKTGTITPIFRGSDRITNLQYAKGTDHFYFQMGLQLFTYNATTGSVSELINFEKGSEPQESAPNYMEEEELKLFEFHQINKKKKEWRADNDIFKGDDIRTIYYNNSSVSNIQISGGGGYITFRLNDYPDSKPTHVENHISENGHTYVSSARSKVSNQDPNHRLGIYDIKNDTVYFADFSELTDIRKKPSYLKDYGDTNLLYDKDRNIIMHELVYTKDGKKNVLDIRSYDNKDRWIVSVSLKNGKVKELDHQHDDAWIGGPGISGWNMVSGTLGWKDDNNTVYFQSEESGYSHLYTVNFDSGERKQLTKGNWEVHEVEYKNDVFFLTINESHPGDRNFGWLEKGSNKLTLALKKSGNYETTLSPNGTQIAFRYSSKTHPWELFYRKNGVNQKITQITYSTTKEFESYTWNAPEVVALKDENDNNVYARLYKPEAAVKNNAAVIFVHGAGYLQNAHNYWSGYYREYMFHNLLRDNGFTVLDIDYRASAGYGRDHRIAIYRHMGGADLEDQLIGRQYLIDSCGIEANRVGIYGGSYGGFITLMALLKHPGKFQAGAAIRSVTDWFHYNHEYTSNILNYPETDPEAYKKSSPIYYAQNLEDHLLMLHGMVDDNVQYQDVIRLSQRFIELGVTNWEMASYPVEPHGFKITSSWVDEYRRIYNLFYNDLILKK